MSLQEKIEIVHKVLIQHYPFKEVAVLHQIKPTLIKSLLSRVRKNNEFFKELQHLNLKKESDNLIIENVVSDIIKSNKIIYNT